MKKQIIVTLFLIAALLFWISVLCVLISAIALIASPDLLLGMLLLIALVPTLIGAVGLTYSARFKEAVSTVPLFFYWP